MRSRRTALIGVGSLLAGVGGLLGTTAFSSVEANRTASVQVAGDDNALLGIEPVDGVDRHVEITNGTVTIDFEGINQNAVTVFDRLFKITNNGNDTITVGFNDTLVVERDTTYEKNPTGTGWAYTGDSKGYLILWGPYQEAIPANDRIGIDTDTLTTTGFTGSEGSGLVNDSFKYEYELRENRIANPGESLFISGTVDMRIEVLSSDPPDDLDNTSTLVAEQYESN